MSLHKISLKRKRNKNKSYVNKIQAFRSSSFAFYVFTELLSSSIQKFRRLSTMWFVTKKKKISSDYNNKKLLDRLLLSFSGFIIEYFDDSWHLSCQLSCQSITQVSLVIIQMTWARRNRQWASQTLIFIPDFKYHKKAKFEKLKINFWESKKFFQSVEKQIEWIWKRILSNLKSFFWKFKKV